MRGVPECTVAAVLLSLAKSTANEPVNSVRDSPTEVASHFARAKPQGLSRRLILIGGLVMILAVVGQAVGLVVFKVDLRAGPLPLFSLAVPMLLMFVVTAVIVDFRLPAEFRQYKALDTAL